MWHYHAVLTCGHRLAFDLKQNLLVEALALDPQAQPAIELPCSSCGTTQSSTDLQVTEGRGPCIACGLGSRPR